VFARVATYSIDGDRIDAAVGAFQAALDRIRTLDGFIDGLILVAPDESRVLSVTYWETRSAMESSSVAASRARSEAVRASEGHVESSCEYRVALRVSEQ
jgi:heme-degrading monooxygenase HmoA